MDRLNVSQLVWFLNESFTKKISGKSKDDIVKDTLNISVEEFRSKMKDFFVRKGYDKGFELLWRGEISRGPAVLFKEIDDIDDIDDRDSFMFNFCYYMKYFRNTPPSRVEVEFSRDFEDKNSFCMDLEVVINNRIRFFSHKVNLNSFDDLDEHYLEKRGLRKDGKNLYSVKETELSLPLLIKMQQFFAKLVEKASKVKIKSLNDALRNALTDKQQIDVIKDFFF